MTFACLYFFRSFAKKPRASFKISFACRNSAFSRSSSRFRIFNSTSLNSGSGAFGLCLLWFLQSANVKYGIPNCAAAFLLPISSDNRIASFLNSSLYFDIFYTFLSCFLLYQILGCLSTLFILYYSGKVNKCAVEKSPKSGKMKINESVLRSGAERNGGKQIRAPRQAAVGALRNAAHSRYFTGERPNGLDVCILTRL